MRQEEGLAFDGIILDAQMPEVDGYELAYQINQEFPAPPPMLMLSSLAVRGDSQRCQAVGITGLFSSRSRQKNCSGHSAASSATRANQQPADTIEPGSPATRLRELQRAMDVLLVEDHPTNQRLALGLLENWGHRASWHKTAWKPIAAFSKRKFDLILDGHADAADGRDRGHAQDTRTGSRARPGAHADPGDDRSGDGR